MSALKEAKVPDIGGHKNVPVIEVLVKVGDSVKKDQGLITLESDKATMEVPAPFAGVVRELKVKLGDEISEGDVVVMLEAADEAATSVPAPIQAEAPKTAEPEVQAVASPVVQVPAVLPAPANSPIRTPPVSFDAEFAGKYTHGGTRVRYVCRH